MSEPRKLASFRLDTKLLTQLQETAERTHRTPRQVVEMAVERVLPFVESGFVDSPDGQNLIGEMEARQRCSDALFARLRAELRAKDGLPPEPKEKERKLAVFRLDGELLMRVRTAAKKTGRNDRQVLELCLRWGVPIAEIWILLEPVFDQLKTDWTQLRTALAGGPSSLPREEWERRLRETVFRTLATVFPRLTGKEMTTEESDDLRTKMLGKWANTAATPAVIPPAPVPALPPAPVLAKPSKPAKKKGKKP